MPSAVRHLVRVRSLLMSVVILHSSPSNVHEFDDDILLVHVTSGGALQLLRPFLKFADPQAVERALRRGAERERGTVLFVYDFNNPKAACEFRF